MSELKWRKQPEQQNQHVPTLQPNEILVGSSGGQAIALALSRGDLIKGGTLTTEILSTDVAGQMIVARNGNVSYEDPPDVGTDEVTIRLLR